MCAQPGVNPLKYIDYGCWCGIGGAGKTMNKLDECCKAHDKCWEMSRKQPGCSSLADLPYIIDYDFTCSNAQVTCSGSNDLCVASVCECDREAAYCFARNEYNPEYKDLDRQTYC
ncbi:acidic phospholipase A2 1-like [Nelusetta ayraudi]|uniref:acidic phospholipase A2 1-like n=1 Tax=Nelusetta ayraudi TaxID=303726 RepID=UPI003F721F20